jgi:hypothetical protein
LREDKKLLGCIETVRCIVREQTVTGLYRDCKVHCEGANRHFVRFSMYRRNLNYEFDLQFLKPKKVRITKNIKGEGKKGKEIEFHSHHEEKV